MDNDLLIKVGERIKKIRQENGLTQEKLAYTSEISYNYIGDIERGKKNISISILNRIAKTFKISLSELLQGIR